MVEYIKVSVKLTDKQLKKLKDAVKNKTRTTLKKSLKMFDECVCVCVYACACACVYTYAYNIDR